MDHKQIHSACAYFKKYNRLPFTQVPCTKTGKLVYMFGDNLTRRVQKYGSIYNLLTQFVCRDAQKNMCIPKHSRTILNKSIVRKLITS